MKPRYNLRIQATTKPNLSITKKKTSVSRVTKKVTIHRSDPLINERTRRQSLRLTPIVKNARSRSSSSVPKWWQVENDQDEETTSITDTHDDDLDDVLARHHRLMHEEQKDRKLYERYIRDQRTLRRLQCRRTHTAHLSESRRNRLLRELERERRYEIHQQISAYLANRTILFRHDHRKEAMNWSSLEEELPYNRNIGTIHELDVMIDNLKKVVRNSNSSSKPRLSVRERQNQRLLPLTPVESNVSPVHELHSSPTSNHPLINLPSPLPIISYSPRVPLVRFTDDPNIKIRTSNSQQLTCIQNVLSHQSRNTTNAMPTPIGIRKSFLRPKSPQLNSSQSFFSAPKNRPLEKENCSILPSSSSNNSRSDILLRSTSPMVSIKHTSFSSSSRTYPNTRKHPLTTRRHTRLSANA